ncbi:MAG: response regulator [Candidatus Aminicenantes bacterium]|nr:response regulator [Candidatus Aminicenantes bacterium]
MPPLKRILYVEDEKDLRAVAKLALESLGAFSVETCGSGEEALEKAPSFQPDLIILDVLMPGMDGKQTLKELKEIPTLENVPVVFMTAWVQPGGIAQYKEAGAFDVIEKPFEPMSLAKKINSIWGRVHRQ